MKIYKISQVEELAPIEEKDPTPLYNYLLEKEREKQNKEKVKFSWSNIDWENKSDEQIATEMGKEMWVVKYHRYVENKRETNFYPYYASILEDQMRGIIRDFRNNMSLTSIAKKFEISPNVIARYLRLVLSEDEIQKILSENKDNLNKSKIIILPEEEKQKIVEMFKKYIPTTTIAHRIGVSPPKIKNIIREKLSMEEIDKIQNIIDKKSKLKLRRLLENQTPTEEANKSKRDYFAVRGNLSDRVLNLYYKERKGVEDISNLLNIDIFILSKYLDEVEKDNFMKSKIEYLKKEYKKNNSKIASNNWYKKAQVESIEETNAVKFWEEIESRFPKVQSWRGYQTFDFGNGVLISLSNTPRNVYTDYLERNSTPRDYATFYLENISSSDKGKGYATKAIEELKRIADKHNIILRLYPKQTEKGKFNLKDNKLKDWYKRKGFGEDLSYGLEESKEFPTQKPLYLERKPNSVEKI